LGKPEEEKKSKKDREVAAPKVIRIEAVTGLEIVFSRYYTTPRMSAV
jgi:hypothetical protein